MNEWEDYDFSAGTTMKPEEVLMLDSPLACVAYSHGVLERPWPEAEYIIARDATASLAYSRKVLKGPFRAGESVMAKFAGIALEYSDRVLKDRFPAGEPAIAREADGGNAIYRALAYRYCQKYDLTPNRPENDNE